MIKIAKFLLRCLLRLLYRVDVKGMEHYHEAGNRVLIVANHTSLLDGLLLYAWLPETPTFAINTEIAQKKTFKFFLMFVDLFIMDPTSPLSVKSMIRFIRTNKKAVIFPEGRITVTGALMKIYEGPGLVADKADAMILPIAIDGAHMSPFSYMRGRGRVVSFPHITLSVMPPVRIKLDPELSGNKRRKAAARALQDIMFELVYSAYDFRRTIFSALLASVQCFGKNHVILEDINRSPLTYKQLLTRCFILARLMGRDTAPGEHIGLLLPNVNGTIIAFLALQSTGRVTAMLNFSSGTQAVLLACETGSIKTVYSSRRFIESAGLQSLAEELGRRVKLVYLEDLRKQVSVCTKLFGWWCGIHPKGHYRKIARRSNPDDPAVILFTSGSEGFPKGVVLSHANILSNYAQVRCHIDFRPSDILFACLPVFHSFGLNAGVLMPLLGGSKVFLYPTPLHYRIIPELIYQIGATILFGSNTFFKGYARYAHPFDFHTLRYTVAGAEKLQDDTQRLWMDKFGIRILQGYGVTEASPVISVNAPLIHKPGTVGPLLPGMDYYLAPVEGIESGGKLMVKGPNIMLGYLLHDAPDRIIPPVTERGPGWHDTGDIVAIDEDDFLTIQGRAKRFAKIGGEMISLTAVEELAVQTWPNFHHAAVSLPDERKGEKIILVTDNPQAEKKHIQETVRRLQYGEIYIPHKVVLAEELPVLGTGKTDYIILTELALAEDREGSGWIKKITNLIKKNNRQDPSETSASS